MTQKKLSGVLSRVSHIYLEGATEFYEKLKPDPWQAAHDELEKSIFKEDELDSAIQTFEAKITELLENYKPFSRNQKGRAATRGLYANSEVQCDVRSSLADKRCGSCGTEKDVKIKNHPDHGPGIFCKPCWEAVIEKIPK